MASNGEGDEDYGLGYQNTLVSLWLVSVYLEMFNFDLNPCLTTRFSGSARLFCR